MCINHSVQWWYIVESHKVENNITRSRDSRVGQTVFQSQLCYVLGKCHVLSYLSPWLPHFK